MHHSIHLFHPLFHILTNSYRDFLLFPGMHVIKIIFETRRMLFIRMTYVTRPVNILTEVGIVIEYLTFYTLFIVVTFKTARDLKNKCRRPVRDSRPSGLNQ